jgi:hypothetical protein
LVPGLTSMMDRVVRTNVELTALARRLKVMRPWERLAETEK